MKRFMLAAFVVAGMVLGSFGSASADWEYGGGYSGGGGGFYCYFGFC